MNQTGEAVFAQVVFAMGIAPTAVALVMLVVSFAMLLVINGLQAWQRRRSAGASA